MHTFQRMSWSFVIGNAFKKYFKRKKNVSFKGRVTQRRKDREKKKRESER